MDGILIVDKPKGLTSHDVVDFVRRRFGLKRVGHAGTLDPMATGVLVVLLGRFTKLSHLFIADDKEYEATLVLGATSDTGDAWGRIAYPNHNLNLNEEAIGDCFKKFLGGIEQTPPMYSAVKFKGKKLYEYARKGLKVTSPPRRVYINRLEILKFALPEVTFEVVCSKGTYVRQLCVDIGERLGCGAYLSYLRRMRSGRFTIGEALELDQLKEFGPKDLEKRLYRL